MSGLEVQTGKVPGTIIRTTPAPRAALVGAMILGLIVLQFVYVVLVFQALFAGANNAAGHDPAIDGAPLGGLFKNEQTIISFWLAGIFFCLSFAIFLYQRHFVDHVTIAKKRYRKWEDEGVQFV